MSARRAIERCDELAALTERPGTICRRIATPALAAAADAIAGYRADAGLSVSRDGLGNLRGRSPGAEPGAPALLAGSHYDTVPGGGRYDGALGVLCAIEAVRAVGTRSLPFEVHAFADEEGVRFSTAYLGSSAVFGTLDPSLAERQDADGITLRAALAAGGGSIDALLPPPRALGYLEVHIEQGPQLERASLPVGIVTAIAGQTRLTLTLTGEAGHAGTVPMEGRRDALVAASEIVLAVESAARDGIVATVGSLLTEPGAANVIPSRVRLSVDLRHPLDATRLDAVESLRRAITSIGERRDVAIEWVVTFDEPAVACAPAMVGALTAAVERQGLRAQLLPSGAGHDAVAIAPHCPVGMLFVRCAGGISHHPAESVSEDDVANAIDVLAATLEELT